jgi:hypothetical protein
LPVKEQIIPRFSANFLRQHHSLNIDKYLLFCYRSPMKWEKKDVAPELVKEIAARYGCDLLTASILARRGHESGDSIRYFLEDDLRHLRSPFALPGMEDAVERIIAAKEEGEKVLDRKRI